MGQRIPFNEGVGISSHMDEGGSFVSGFFCREKEGLANCQRIWVGQLVGVNNGLWGEAVKGGDAVYRIIWLDGVYGHVLRFLF